MRQGTFDLYLWTDTPLDISIDSRTPGLFESNPEDMLAHRETASES